MALDNFTAKDAATKDPALRTQVRAAVTAAAGYIMNGGSPLNRQHEANAEQASRNPEQFVDWFIWPVVNDTTVAANYPNQTDAQVRQVIDSN